MGKNFDIFVNIRQPWRVTKLIIKQAFLYLQYETLSKGRNMTATSEKYAEL